MKFSALAAVELKKLRRSKILLILAAPVILMWVPSVLNSASVLAPSVSIAPENNFFIQGFMGMSWFMIPATLVICTVLLQQTERTGHGILKMLSLPVSTAKLCLAKMFTLILLALVQMILSVAAYYLSAQAASQLQDYRFLLSPAYVIPAVASLYAAAVPMAAVFWMISTLITSPVFSAGIGLASVVPSVLFINTKVWFLYPMSYPFYLLMIQYGRVSPDIYGSQIDWLPWLPAAVLITAAAVAVSCLRFGAAERKKL